MAGRKLIQTKDGSSSVYDAYWNASFHSIHGAITESNQVYIISGLQQLQFNGPSLQIFEFGFGTGLNAFLSLAYSQELSILIEYTVIDSCILEMDLVYQLDYPKQSNLRKYADSFYRMHQVSWGKPSQIDTNFTLHKIQLDWNLFEPEFEQHFDLIYFDAFGPEVQPELWNYDSLLKTHKILKLGGLLCTYCAKGSVKRLLKQIGFKVESLNGPPGKREITRAVKL